MFFYQYCNLFDENPNYFFIERYEKKSKRIRDFDSVQKQRDMNKKINFRQIS